MRIQHEWQDNCWEEEFEFRLAAWSRSPVAGGVRLGDHSKQVHVSGA